MPWLAWCQWLAEKVDAYAMQTFRLTKAGFGYVNSVSLQTDDAGHVGAAVLAHVFKYNMKKNKIHRFWIHGWTLLLGLFAYFV